MGLDISAQEFFGQRIFQIALDRAAHRTGAVVRIVSFLDEEILRGFLEDQEEYPSP